MFRIPAYSVLLLACGLALGTLHGDRTLLLRATREDGPVEWATVLTLFVLVWVLARHLYQDKDSRLPRWVKASAVGLACFAVFAAGEEISWGQRVFGFATGETMQRLNLQNETNLHNLIPGALFNGIIVFSLGIGFVLIPTIWRRRSEVAPPWLPTPEVSLLMLDAILINHYRFATLPEQVGIGVIVALLLLATIDALGRRDLPLVAASLAGWMTMGCLAYSRAVLRVHNHQYEIRELLIVILAVVWADQTLRAYKARSDEA